MMEVLGVWIAAGLTLCIFSFLYKDNPFYKFAEHLYVGFSAGYWLVYTWEYTIKGMLIDPIRLQQAYSVLIPGFFGILMLSRWFPKIAYLSRISISFTVGIGAGLALTGQIHGFILPQLKATLLPLTSLNNFLIVFGVITTLFYFFFSKERKGATYVFARIGIIYIMIAFGAAFGYTVMARISLLIGRFLFLLKDWLHIIRI